MTDARWHRNIARGCHSRAVNAAQRPPVTEQTPALAGSLGRAYLRGSESCHSRKLDAQTRPPRQWALVGYPAPVPATGADARPLLVIDSLITASAEGAGWPGRHRRLRTSENWRPRPAAHAEPLRQNMGGAGVRTVVIDSLTAIIAPITTQAVMANDAGENKNRIAAFRDKALALRLLQDSITGWAATRCGSTITATPETARRRRSRRPRSPPWSSPACAAA